MTKILVLAHPYDPLAYCVGRAFHESFMSLGHQSCLKEEYKSGYDLCLVMYAHIGYNFPKDNTYKIAYNWECLLHPMWRKRVHRALEQFNCIFECSEENLKIDLPIRRVVCPIGYHSSFEIPCLAGEWYKVALIGYAPKHSYRGNTIKSLEQSLGFKIWHVSSKENNWANSSNQLLNKVIFNTDIHLNIHRNPKFRMFESLRVIMLLLSNKCFVISESSDGNPLVSGKHLIETEDLLNTIKSYLNCPSECNQIAQDGYQFVKTSYRLEDHVSTCLKQIEYSW